MTPGTRNNGLRLQLAGSDVGGLRIIGTMPGVVITAAAARNGPGAGLLISSPGSLLSWQAPGSTTPGPAQNVASGGGAMLEDGADPSCWINLMVYPAYLPGTAQAQISLADSFNDMGPADVAASDAMAGLVTTTQYTLYNGTANTLTSAALWIDPTASGSADLAVSGDGIHYFEPTTQTDPNVLTWATIAAGASVDVWVQRTIAAASASNPQILNVLQWAWSGIA